MLKLKNRNCPVCGSHYSSNIKRTPFFVREFDGPTVKKCDRCDMVFLNPAMTEEAYWDFYSNDEQKNFAQNITKGNYNAKISDNDMRREKMIAAYIGAPGRILDVGTGRSKFVGLVNNAVGIDISEERIRDAKEMGLPVELCDIYGWDERAATITMFHVLEHILDPVRFLKRAHEILLPNGSLIIEVPNLNDALVGLKAYEKFYYQNAHCSYFTPKTLRQLVGSSGFVVERELKIQRYSFDNHLHWLFRKRPGIIGAASFMNDIYSCAIKQFDAHDTIFLICGRPVQ